MPTPSVEQRRSDIRIWIVAFLFLLFIVSGGVFLALYISLPESKDTAWYPIAGMVLVAIPWLFWLITFMYRCCIKGDGGDDSPPNGPTSAQDFPNNTLPEEMEQQEEQSQQKEGDSYHSHDSEELPLALSMSKS